MKERLEQTNAAEISETLEKVWNIFSERIDHYIRLNSKHMEQHRIQKSLLEYLYSNTY